MIGAILARVEDVERRKPAESKAPIQQQVDKVAAVFVPLVPFSLYRWHGVPFSVFLFVCSALGFQSMLTSV